MSRNSVIFSPIDSYGIIGNLQTTALISPHGSIDFLCMPDFDSPTVFAALLDQQKGGCFEIHPRMKDTKYKQLYLTDTAILVTRFFSDEGAGEVSDWVMINEQKESFTLIRKLTAIHGALTYDMVCAPAFHYAQHVHQIEQVDHGHIHFATGDQELFLTSSHKLSINQQTAVATVSLMPEETAWFILSDEQPSPAMINDIDKFGRQCYEQTFSWWKNWIAGSTFKGRWIDPIFRSAIILKLLSSKKYGSFVAAPTFGLPEEIGGERNWDYRYTWIRDAAFTMYAFLKLGFTEEATAFLNWVEKYCIEGEINLVYTFRGDKPPEEKILDFRGYKNSIPVRIVQHRSLAETQSSRARACRWN